VDKVGACHRVFHWPADKEDTVGKAGTVDTVDTAGLVHGTAHDLLVVERTRSNVRAHTLGDQAQRVSLDDI
jgi:hypothetical protein